MENSPDNDQQLLQIQKQDKLLYNSDKILQKILEEIVQTAEILCVDHFVALAQAK